MPKRLTQEGFEQRLAAISPDIEVLGGFANVHTKLVCRCRVCGTVWSVTPGSLLRGTGGPACYRKNKTKSHDQFVKELAAANPDTEVLGKYVNAKTKLDCGWLSLAVR